MNAWLYALKVKQGSIRDSCTKAHANLLMPLFSSETNVRLGVLKLNILKLRRPAERWTIISFIRTVHKLFIFCFLNKNNSNGSHTYISSLAVSYSPIC